MIENLKLIDQFNFDDFSEVERYMMLCADPEWVAAQNWRELQVCDIVISIRWDEKN